MLMSGRSSIFNAIGVSRTDGQSLRHQKKKCEIQEIWRTILVAAEPKISTQAYLIIDSSLNIRLPVALKEGLTSDVGDASAASR